MNVTKHFALAAAAMMLVLAGCPSEDEKVCSDFCGAGAACVGGTCQAVLTCSPTCGTDETCVNGACTATVDAACSAGCAADQVCVVANDAAACVEICGSNQLWNAETQQCELQISMDHSRYFSGFAAGDLADGPAVTAECLKCHSVDAAQMAGSAHFKWLGASPLLAGHEADTAAVGKKNLINNFCVAVASNETRCTQCHAGYGDPGTATTAGTPGYDLTALGRVDCLICHADLSGSRYVKNQASWGAAFVANTGAACTPGCTPDKYCNNGTCEVPSAGLISQVVTDAAKSVGRPNRTNCGWCHFYAGGGDNVKMGDLASSLKAPTMAADVHMGSDGGNMVCVDCHVSSQHKIFGTGVSVAVAEGRTDCTDCHAAANHPAVLTFSSDPATKAAQTATHLARVACQTCHIPAFSRQLRTKMQWDWRLAGYKDCKFPVTAAEEAAWGDLDTDGDGYADTFPGATCAPTAAYSPSVSWVGADGKHYEYDWRKGVFLKEDNVAPAYKFFDGKGSHLTIADAFTQAGTAADPVVIAAPTADSSTVGAKIAPFKEMRGTQPGMADKTFLVVPYLYPMKDSAGATVPGALWAPTTLPANSLTADVMQGKWNTLLTVGARKGGQIADTDSLDTADWSWVETRMYMNINHEVAPKGSALGCTACHSNSGVVPMCELFGNSPPSTLWGVTCP